MIRVTIFKHSLDMTLGFRLEKDSAGRILISRIAPNSVLYHTVVHEGMIVCLVNGIICEGMSLTFVSSILRDAKGVIELGVRDPNGFKVLGGGSPSSHNSMDFDCRSIMDEDPAADDDACTIVCVSKLKRQTDSIGLRLRVSNATGCIVIENIAMGGMFGDTALRPGMRLLRVNNIDVNGCALNDIINIIRYTDGELTLEALKVASGQTACSSSPSPSSSSSSSPSKFKVCMQRVGEMGKVVTTQATRLNSKQWGMILRAGITVLLAI